MFLPYPRSLAVNFSVNSDYPAYILVSTYFYKKIPFKNLPRSLSPYVIHLFFLRTILKGNTLEMLPRILEHSRRRFQHRCFFFLGGDSEACCNHWFNWQVIFFGCFYLLWIWEEDVHWIDNHLNGIHAVCIKCLPCNRDQCLIYLIC